MDFDVIDPKHSKPIKRRVPRPKVATKEEDLLHLGNRTKPSPGPFTLGETRHYAWPNALIPIFDSDDCTVAFIPCREDGTYNEANLKLILEGLKNEKGV